MTQQLPKYAQPSCSSCGDPINMLTCTSYEEYKWNPETGRYEHSSPYGGSSAFKCTCGEELTEDKWENGPENYQAPTFEETIKKVRERHPIGDYRYCETCKEYFDFYKYGDLKSAGHDHPGVRIPTSEEYEKLLKDEVEDGCWEE